MSVISLPTCPPIIGRNLRANRPAQVNRSEWTNRRKVAVVAAATMWTAEVGPIEVHTDEHFWTWSAFFAKLAGKANTFRLPVLAKAQLTGVTVRVNGGGQTGASLITDGWGSTGLKAGQFVTVADQLFVLTADATPSAGAVTLSLDRPLWAAPADNAVVTVDFPTALMFMSDDSSGWQDSTAPWDASGEGRRIISFVCEEAVGGA